MTEPRYPQQVVLEVTNRCNLRCRFCHFHGEEAEPRRAVDSMPTAVWQRVLDELQTWPTAVNLMTHGAGEPLLYPGLRELLVRAAGIPNITVGFMTNAMLLDRAWSAGLVATGVDWLALSIDGVDPVTHDAFRRHADLIRIEENVLGLVEEKRRKGSRQPELDFNMVAYPEIRDQAQDYVRRWSPHARSVSIARFRPVGSRRLWEGSAPVPFRPCPLLYHQMVVAADGGIGLCCEDIFLDIPLGHAQGDRLAEVFNTSPPLVAHRKAHEEGQRAALPLCRDCDVWAADHVLTQETVEVGSVPVQHTRTPAGDSYRRLTCPP